MSSDLQSAIKDRRSKLEQIGREYPDKGVEFLQIHLPDLPGILRTKYSPFKVSPEGEALNAIFYSMTHSEGAPVGDVVFDAPICSQENGYPNILALADPDSAAIHGWRPNTASIMLNSFLLDGSPCSLDVRSCLKRIEDQAHAMGFASRFAVEYEFGIFHHDRELIEAGRISELKPFGRSFTNYDILRAPGYEDLIQEFMGRMDSIGAPVASLTSEYGRGMYEFALKPLPPLAAADAAVRAKHHMKELCLEGGLVATFMTRYQSPGDDSASGAHIHQSLIDSSSDKNAFYCTDAEFSPTGYRYIAGLLRTMADMHLIFRPTINSYRRMDRAAWSPEEVYWGIENRLSPIRMINRPTAEACRVEHRCAGPDMNPYLAITAMLAGGLKGIKDSWDPGDPALGYSESAMRNAPLPRSLQESIDAFEKSDFARETFGEDLCRHYIRSRQNEIAAYESWHAEHITAFEYQRYFQGV